MDNATFAQQLAAKDRELVGLRQAVRDAAQTSKRLVEVATILNSTLNLRDLLQLIIGTARDLLHAEDSSLQLLEEVTGDLIFYVLTHDPGGQLGEHRIPSGRGVAGWVAQHGQPVLVDTPAEDPRFYNEIDRLAGMQTRNLLAVPLRLNDEQIIGVMEAINKQGAPTFTDKDLELATALASLAAIAIQNARLNARLTDAVVTARLSYRL